MKTLLHIRVGKTFAYGNGTPEGLLKNKQAQFLLAAGGTYDPGTPMGSFNFVEPYLRTTLASSESPTPNS